MPNAASPNNTGLVTRNPRRNSVNEQQPSAPQTVPKIEPISRPSSSLASPPVQNSPAQQFTQTGFASGSGNSNLNWATPPQSTPQTPTQSQPVSGSQPFANASLPPRPAGLPPPLGTQKPLPQMQRPGSRTGHSAPSTPNMSQTSFSNGHPQHSPGTSFQTPNGQFIEDRNERARPAGRFDSQFTKMGNRPHSAMDQRPGSQQMPPPQFGQQGQQRPPFSSPQLPSQPFNYQQHATANPYLTNPSIPTNTSPGYWPGSQASPLFNANNVNGIQTDQNRPADPRQRR
jgi:hypothetical protein